MTDNQHGNANYALGVNDSALRSIQRWNIGLTVLHAAQAVVLAILAGSFSIAVTATFPSGPPGSAPSVAESLFDIRIGNAIAIFLLLAAIDHGLTATVLRKRYETDLRRGMNRFRWIEYSISASIMIVLIGFYNGITDIVAVIAIIGTNVSMILLGWLQEVANPPGREHTTMLPFWFGCIAGIAPWVAITINTAGAGSAVPGFVYGIIISLFIFFSSFAINQYLQYKRVGPWRSYAFGEMVYLVLSLVAKSALAWQIFGGSLTA